jgi:ribosomal protein S18 acetylase RimI-like enzyme
MTIRVEQAALATAEVVDALARLVPQLSRSNPPPTAEQLQAVIDGPGTHLLLARADDGAVVGMLTLVLFRIPTGLRAWIEDVVVDEAGRGQGVGKALTNAALDIARAAGATTVDLTSRPSREAANAMYQRLGFVLRDTNVYRYEL